MKIDLVDGDRLRQRVAQPAGRWSATRRIVVAAIALGILAAYLTPIVIFLHERLQTKSPTLDASHQVALDMKITVADFVKGIVTLQLVPTGGTLLKPNGRLAHDVTLETDPGSGTVSHTFRADMPLTPWVVSTAPDEGDILDYPFDHYKLDLELVARSEGKPITLSTDLEEVPHGFRAQSVEGSTASGDTEVKVDVWRTGTIVFVALLSTISLILVSGAACAVAWHVAVHRRKIEFSMMIWTAALLFVIPTVRGAMPGGVPTGALIDYLVFFWLQIAIAVAMASLVITWVRRPAA